MNVKGTPNEKRSVPPSILTSNKALKLAELWVNNMTEVADDETTIEVNEGSRPSRLGLGAKVARQTRVVNMNDPLERKLLAKLGAGKRKDAKLAEEPTPTLRDDSDDEETRNLDSRTNAFTNKRPPTPTTHVFPQRGLKKPK